MSRTRPADRVEVAPSRHGTHLTIHAGVSAGDVRRALAGIPDDAPLAWAAGDADSFIEVEFVARPYLDDFLAESREAWHGGLSPWTASALAADMFDGHPDLSG